MIARRQLTEDVIEALAALESPPKHVDLTRGQVPRSSDLEVLRWCVAADAILDEQLLRALSVPLPIHVQSMIGAHAT